MDILGTFVALPVIMFVVCALPLLLVGAHFVTSFSRHRAKRFWLRKNREGGTLFLGLTGTSLAKGE